MNVLKVGIGNDSPGGNVAASHIQGGECMKSVTLKLTLEELRMLATLASEQVFRRQFIDTRMPGHKRNSDQMKLHGKTLAASHQLSPERPRDRLLTRLVENEDVLLGVRSLLTEAVQANRRLTPAGEWLLDNFYLIEEQIRTARRHLPKNY